MLTFLLFVTLCGATAATNSSCSGFTTCSSLGVERALYNNSLVCSPEWDSVLGSVYGYFSDCALNSAAVRILGAVKIDWGVYGSMEALFDDETIYKDTCSYGDVAAAACLYANLQSEGEGLVQSDMFCQLECMNLVDKCLDLSNYPSLRDQAAVVCNEVTAPDNTTNCFKASFNETGLSTPKCNGSVGAVSLTGPYVLAGIAFAIAVVALIGLILTTCKGQSNGGAPGSF